MKHQTHKTTASRADAARRRRARGADALVARYLLELSGRHGRRPATQGRA